jgi:uncharacterized ParB-like nuclease family protein
MLLKKVRIGLDPTSDSTKVDAVTAPFEASHVSAVRTPVLNAQAPSTPLPPVDEMQKVNQVSERLERVCHRSVFHD